MRPGGVRLAAPVAEGVGDRGKKNRAYAAGFTAFRSSSTSGTDTAAAAV